MYSVAGINPPNQPKLNTMIAQYSQYEHQAAKNELGQAIRTAENAYFSNESDGRLAELDAVTEEASAKVEVYAALLKYQTAQQKRIRRSIGCQQLLSEQM
jgi:hypothetical protein